MECFRGKWRRNDTLTFIEKYAGIPRDLIRIDDLSGGTVYKREAVRSISLMLYEAIEDIAERCVAPEDMEPVTVRQRPDGMTGKVREIAMLCIMHQLLGHAVKLMIDPLLQARILPTQHASIPGHGQTRLKDQMHRYFLCKSLGIRHFQKTDVVHAYATLSYRVCTTILRREIPKAQTALALMDYLGTVAPGGHLIIGGYLDAWLFNLAMSYAVRYLYTLGTVRRGKRIPWALRCVTFMDDFAVCSGSVKSLKRAVNALGKWLRREQGVEIRTTTGIVKLLPIETEQERRSRPQRTAARGVPMLDMAGYRVCRTHITIRRRVFKRARRQLLRGWRELAATGTLRRFRAEKLLSYNSFIRQTDSHCLEENYHVRELMRVARRVTGFYSRLDFTKRMEELYVLQQRRRGFKALEGAC